MRRQDNRPGMEMRDAETGIKNAKKGEQKVDDRRRGSIDAHVTESAAASYNWRKKSLS